MTNRRNSIILALGVGLMLALPAVTSAQTARVAGLAVQGDYIKDYTGIYTYTSQVSNVGNLIYGELGNIGGPPPVTSDRAVGAVLGNLWDGRWGTWAIHLREETPQLGQGDAGTNPAPGVDGADPNQNSFESFDLMWGKKFGTKSIGLRLNRSFGAVEYTGADVLGGLTKTEGGGNLNRNVIGFGGGIGFEMNPNTNLEMNILFQNRTYLNENTAAAATSSEDGPTTYQAAARAWWQWRPDVMVVPVVKFYSYDLSSKTGTTITDAKMTGWQGGLAGNWALGSNDLFVLGATFARNKEETNNKNNVTTETFSPQVFAALEAHINSWLTARFGANKAAVHSREVEVVSPAGSTNTKGGGQATFNFALGAGLKFGNLQIDATLDDQFPHNMPYFISGNTTGGMFPKVTATYPF